MDQDARSTLTTLDRGSRSMWMFKIKPPGQVGSVRRSATLFCFYGDTAFDLHSHVIAVAEKKLSHILHCVDWIPHVSSPRLEKLSWINRQREASVQPANWDVAAHVRFTPESGNRGSRVITKSRFLKLMPVLTHPEDFLHSLSPPLHSRVFPS